MKSASLSKAHNPRSHRLDAKELAALFGVSLRTLAKMIGANEATVRTRSDSPNLQNGLRELVLAYDGLGVVLPADEIPRWVHHPLKTLDGLTPIELAQHHGASALRKLVDEMTAGGYS